MFRVTFQSEYDPTCHMINFGTSTMLGGWSTTTVDIYDPKLVNNNNNQDHIQQHWVELQNEALLEDFSGLFSLQFDMFSGICGQEYSEKTPKFVPLEFLVNFTKSSFYEYDVEWYQKQFGCKMNITFVCFIIFT